MVGGEVDQVWLFSLIALSLGLQLNTAKCKLILSGMDEVAANQTLLRFQKLAPSIHPVFPRGQRLGANIVESHKSACVGSWLTVLAHMGSAVQRAVDVSQTSGSK